MGSEADGVDGVPRATRQLIKEGADFIKVMATGGSTVTSDPYRPAYTVDELRTIADEAHRRQKVVAAHCRCTEGMSYALEAGIDIIVHGFFAGEAGIRRFDRQVADRIAKDSVWVNPTLHIARSRMWRLQQKKEGEGLTEQEEDRLARSEESYGMGLQECGQLIQSGAKLVAGSDCGWEVYPFGQFAHEISALAEAGLTPMEAVLAGTRNCAQAIDILGQVGTVEAGKEANLLVVEGDPVEDIAALNKVVAVFNGGQMVGARGPESYLRCG
jgi:imidazolonepropionase-like amidohydrolase